MMPDAAAVWAVALSIGEHVESVVIERERQEAAAATRRETYMRLKEHGIDRPELLFRTA